MLSSIKSAKHMCACMMACSKNKIGCSQWTQYNRPSTVDPAEGTCLVGSRSREGRNGFLLGGVPHLQVRHQHGLGLPPRDGQTANLPPVAEQTPASPIPIAKQLFLELFCHICVSFLRKGQANLLCIVRTLTDVPAWPTVTAKQCVDGHIYR